MALPIASRENEKPRPPTPEGIALAIDDLIDAKITARVEAAMVNVGNAGQSRQIASLAEANKKFVVLVEELKRIWRDHG